MSLAKEFREFAMRGNVVDLAVGVIIGGAFGKIVSALVENIIMPPIGVLIGGVDFKGLELVLKPGVTMKYGVFLQAVVDFVIIAFAIFLMVKAMNSVKKKEAAAPAAPPAPTASETLLAEIRDLLRKKS
jgi:large conductance mechanosensitive channel